MSHIIVLIAILIPAMVLADARIEYTDEAGAETLVYKISDGKVLMEDASSGSGGLFDSSDGSMTMFDSRSREYIRMDREKAAEMGESVNAAMAEMQKRLDSMPPEQREMMKQYMPEMMKSAADPPSITVDRTGEETEFNGADCEKVLVFRNGEPFQEVCVASRKAVGLSEADYSTLKAMFDALASFSSQVGNRAGVGEELGKLDGIPVRTVDMAGAGATFVLKSVSTDALPAGEVAIPAGYTEREVSVPQF